MSEQPITEMNTGDITYFEGKALKLLAPIDDNGAWLAKDAFSEPEQPAFYVVDDIEGNITRKLSAAVYWILKETSPGYVAVMVREYEQAIRDEAKESFKNGCEQGVIAVTKKLQCMLGIDRVIEAIEQRGK